MTFATSKRHLLCCGSKSVQVAVRRRCKVRAVFGEPVLPIEEAINVIDQVTNIILNHNICCCVQHGIPSGSQPLALCTKIWERSLDQKGGCTYGPHPETNSKPHVCKCVALLEASEKRMAAI